MRLSLCPHKAFPVRMRRDFFFSSYDSNPFGEGPTFMTYLALVSTLKTLIGYFSLIVAKHLTKGLLLLTV